MKPAIIDITGVGPAAVDALSEHGINKLGKLAGASIEQVAAVPGFSEARAARVIAAAADLLAEHGLAKPGGDEKDKTAKPDRKDRKGKKNKKGKKGKKDKKRKRKGRGKKKGRK